MTPLEFLESKGITNLVQPLQAAKVELLLEEYGDLVLSVAAEKAEILEYFELDYQWYSVDKGSILNCLKDK